MLDDAGISRRHAEIRPGAEGWTVADLGSTNGVRLNGRDASRAPQPLHAGDRVELGSTEIVFEAWMTTLAPVSVALKFGFLAVLYLFVLWVARSARRDLRRGDAALASQRGRRAAADRRPTRPACTRPRRVGRRRCRAPLAAAGRRARARATSRG